MKTIDQKVNEVINTLLFIIDLLLQHMYLIMYIKKYILRIRDRLVFIIKGRGRENQKMNANKPVVNIM